MPINTEMRAALARMERARDDTLRQLDIIHRQIAVRTKRMAVSFRTKARQRRKGSWALAVERCYCENLGALRCYRRTEIDVLARNLSQQNASIEACRPRLHGGRKRDALPRHHVSGRQGPPMGGDSDSPIPRKSKPAKGGRP